jgi:hypothetical protein
MTDPTASPVLSQLLTIDNVGRTPEWKETAFAGHPEQASTPGEIAPKNDELLAQLDAQRATVARLTQENEALREMVADLKLSVRMVADAASDSRPDKQ